MNKKIDTYIDTSITIPKYWVMLEFALNKKKMDNVLINLNMKLELKIKFSVEYLKIGGVNL